MAALAAALGPLEDLRDSAHLRELAARHRAVIELLTDDGSGVIAFRGQRRRRR